MERTIFDKILAGQVPCHRIYEDAHVLAFLDVAPLSYGHSLLIPKERAKSLDALSDAAGAALGRVLPRLCRAVVALSGVRDYNVLQNNGVPAHQGVFHVHFHVIPKGPQDGLVLQWRPGRLSDAEGTALAQKMAQHLGRVAGSRNAP